MTEDDKILQIMSADGWFAVHRGEDDQEALDPVVCFALVEVTEDGKAMRTVRPMSWADDMIDFSDEADDMQDDEDEE